MDIFVKVLLLSLALVSSFKVTFKEVLYNEVRIGDAVNATVDDDFTTESLSDCSMRYKHF